MGSKRKDVAESNDERRERKRLKKEAKAARKNKKHQQSHEREKGESVTQEEIKCHGERTGDRSIKENHFTEKRLEMTVSLLPASAMSNVQRHVEDSIRRFLFKYCDGVDGIVLSFENVTILNDGRGFVYNELPYIHYNVACDALVFQPLVESFLTGEVTESSFHSHLSLIVLNYFNASIPATELRKAGFDFHFDEEDGSHTWKKDGPDGKIISAGQKVQFYVKRLNESSGIISIEGATPSLIEATNEL